MSTARPLIDSSRRRALLAARHLLSPPHRARTPEQVAGAVVALHSSDPATVFLSAAARLEHSDTAALESALYERQTLVRMHGMRHTLFVLPEELASVVQSSTTRKVAEKERRMFTAFAAGGGFSPDWLAKVERLTLAALADCEQASASRLAELVPELREAVPVAVGKPYQSTHTIGTRLLRVLGMEGEIVRGRPLGGWTSGQYRWALRAPLAELPVAEAQAELVRRWLAAYGPATAEDVRWWTGWGVREVRAALTACAAAPVRLDVGDGAGDVEGYALPEDADGATDGPEPEPWAALLPGLDPTPMGWRQRDWFLPAEHRADLFDRSGNIGPTVWWNGRIVGGWAQRADGEIVRELLEPVGAEAEAAIDAESARLAVWLGPVRVTPRFRTPLERRLSSR
ncbi:winged helix DNA-binding domain-containing protein [Kitasatospora cystarginea]|uniref:Winged helix DNA-binding domain-containing protein n=1 Tax=Kitasatospora cystarginea TaxID=58350 RepID=A0ABN3DPT8_9ACTN